MALLAERIDRLLHGAHAGRTRLDEAVKRPVADTQLGWELGLAPGNRNNVLVCKALGLERTEGCVEHGTRRVRECVNARGHGTGDSLRVSAVNSQNSR